MPQIYDMGPTALLRLRRKVCWGFFFQYYWYHLCFYIPLIIIIIIIIIQNSVSVCRIADIRSNWNRLYRRMTKTDVETMLVSSKGKAKCTLVHALRLCTGRTVHRVRRRIALLFLDHGARRGEGWALRPGHSLPLGMTRYLLYRRLGGPQGRSGQVRKISPPPPGFNPRTVQPVASRYTDWAIAAHY